MLLNRIFVWMFFIAMIMGLSKLIFWHDLTIFEKIVNSMFDAAKSGFEIALFLTGSICLWMGLMKVGEAGGAVRHLTKFVAPLFSKIFPEVPKDHPAVGAMMMNISANMLGLDNAATPMGLKAMKELQTLNPTPEIATNAQIMFIVLNSAGLTIIPVSILALRAANGSKTPSEVFLPILITTFFTFLFALLYVGIKQKINLLNKTILLYLGSLTAFLIGLIYYLTQHPDMVKPVSSVGSTLILFTIVILFLILAVRSKIDVLENFVEGAKGGFEVALNIVPFLVGILTAVAVFKSCGAMGDLMFFIKNSLNYLGLIHTEFVEALPVSIMKSFSGSGARALMVDLFKTPGVDSFVGKLAATFQGSTETTFYVIAIYFGSVKVKNTRYAAKAGLLADVFGAIVAIFIAYLFYEVK